MTVWILRHDSDDDPGPLPEIIAAEGLSAHRVDVATLAAWPPLAEVSAVVILGGSMNVDDEAAHPWLAAEKAWIRAVIDAGLPLLGICLGGQLLARCLGATVHRHRHGEIGWTPLQQTPAGEADPVLSALGDGTPQFQWHEDSFDLPVGADLLAATTGCPHQAFRLAGHPVYGLQFHPEVTLEKVTRWLAESSSLPERQRRAILTQTEAVFSQAAAASERMLQAFFHQVVRVA